MNPLAKKVCLPLVNIRKPDTPLSFRATIYTLICTKVEQDPKYQGRYLYVGSTSSPLDKRLRSHRAQALLNMETWNGIHSYMLAQGPDHFEIQALEVLDNCVNRNQLKKMEEEWRRFLNPVFNTKSAYPNLDQEVDSYPAFYDYVLTCTCKK